MLYLAFSGIVGPLIGGLLVDSGTGESKAEYPYFGACFFGALLCLLALPVTHIYFREPKELRHAKTERDADDSMIDKLNTGAAAGGRGGKETMALVEELFSINGAKQLWTSLKEPLVGGKVVLPILLYVLIAFCNRSWSTLLPLLFAAKQELGGLGFTAFDTSFAMTAIVTRLGMNKAYCLGMAVIIPACVVISMTGGSSGSGWSWFVVLCCTSAFGFVEALTYLSVIMMITDSVPASSLGAAHGLSATCAAAVRTFAPPLVGYIWEYVSIEHTMPWTGFLVVQIGAAASIFIASRYGSKVAASGYSRVQEDVEMSILHE
ncbi:UNVERIFIED_CONTAM: hypothetical protein HDU68_005511 [Siphonaria sp. JEL0065]|nr:hypothetical protein HDU68_005511 [Siphonaria sp. JEL0065]